LWEASCGFCWSWFSRTCSAIFGRLLSTSMTIRRFSAALRWLCSLPLETEGWHTKAIVNKQPYSVILMASSSYGHLYHRRDGNGQEEERIRSSYAMSSVLRLFSIQFDTMDRLQVGHQRTQKRAISHLRGGKTWR